MPGDPQLQPRAMASRAPDVFKPGAWIPMRQHRDADVVDFAIVGTGAGGGTLACKLAEAGFSVVAFDAGAYYRPLEDFASDERDQSKLFWTDERIVDGDHPLALGSNNSGRAVGGSTVHYAMVSLRFRPEWFRSRTKLGYGADWPIDWREMWRYYLEVEQALKIAGPITYPWDRSVPAIHTVRIRSMPQRCISPEVPRRLGSTGPKPRSRPCRRHAAKHRPASIEASASRAATNAKQSVLVTWLPRALRAGAEIRDLAMVGRIGMNAAGRATGVDYYRDGRWHFQKAWNVVVAGYAIETPRLLLNSATGGFPDGLANGSGLVGRNLMVQSNQAVFGTATEEIRSYKGRPASLSASIGITTTARISSVAIAT